MYIVQHSINPSENNFPFDGKIWFLTDNRTASVGELAVLYAQSSNFATIVGENTMGIMPSQRSFVRLPNTGIIFMFDAGYFIDATGRSMEEFGIPPHYPNRPGLSTFNTILQMIEEMDQN